MFLLSPFSGTQLLHKAQRYFVINGFKTWWKLNPKVIEHERSLNTVSIWKEMAMRLDKGQTLDYSLQKEIEIDM